MGNTRWVAKSIDTICAAQTLRKEECDKECRFMYDGLRAREDLQEIRCKFEYRSHTKSASSTCIQQIQPQS
jgi:flavodoxin